MKVKHTLLIILAVLVVLSPTIALAGCYFYSSSVKSEVVSASIKDDLGKVTECRRGEPYFELFKNMLGTGGDTQPTALTALPEKALSYVQYTALFTDSFSVESAYTYYFSANAGECYFTDGENRAFRIASSGASAFLDSDYAERIYTDAQPPTITIGSTLIQPYTLDWSYKTVSGAMKKSSACYSDRNESTTLKGFLSAFSPSFSIEPDEIEVEVKDKNDGAGLYTGAYEGLRELKVDGSKEVTVNMTAVWKNGEQKAYAGSAKYFFEGRMFGSAAFKLSTNAARCGEVVILSAFNVIDPADIKVETEPALSFPLKFYKTGDSWQALIPLAIDAVKSNTAVTFTVSTPSATDVLLLMVTPLNKGSFNYAGSNFEKIYTESILADLQEKMSPVANAESGFAFTGGKFLIPTSNNYVSQTSNYDFGTTVNLRTIGKSFVALDRMYCANMGKKGADGKVAEGTSTSVLAAFDGKVVYVGSHTYTGRVVVIDHGSGLRTWYTNLSSDIAVKVGDTVKAGQFLSHAADGGLNSDNNFNFHVGVTVNGVPVDIQPLIDKGLIGARA